MGYDLCVDFKNRIPSIQDNNKIEISYFDGPKVEVLGDIQKEYFVEFLDESDNVIHSSTITNNMWTNCGRKYYTKWKIRINGQIVEELNLENKKVLISFGSSSLGDTIAWIPYVHEFEKKHKCKVVLSTFHNHLFSGLEIYKNIKFIEPGSFANYDVKYEIGWFSNEKGEWSRFDMYPNPLNSQELQKTASDILGLDFYELNYGIDFTPKNRPYKQKYVVFAPQSTAGCKEWTLKGWNILSKFLQKDGYKIIVLSHRPINIENSTNLTNLNLDECMNIMFYADHFIGLSSGLSWVNWCLGKHTFMISGFTEKKHEFQNNNTRIQNSYSCNSCWSNSNFIFDKGDWDWCPIWKGTDKQHICQKSISPLTVYEYILNYEKK
jgi:autotransporter strand-loop-strand O-heptosyltransferase